MLDFKDINILDYYKMNIDNIKPHLRMILNSTEEVSHIEEYICELSNKIVKDYIATGKLDAYIAENGNGFVEKLSDKIARDMGAVLLSTLGENGICTQYWDIPLGQIQPDYRAAVKVTEKNMGYFKEDDLTKNYRDETKHIVNIVMDSFHSSKEQPKSLELTEKTLLANISNVIIERTTLLEEDIYKQAMNELKLKENSVGNEVLNSDAVINKPLGAIGKFVQSKNENIKENIIDKNNDEEVLE